MATKDVLQTTLLRTQIREMEKELVDVTLQEKEERAALDREQLEFQQISAHRQHLLDAALRELETIRETHGDLQRQVDEVRATRNDVVRGVQETKVKLTLNEEAIAEYQAAVRAPVASQGVTICFASIEHATELWEWDADCMSRSVELFLRTVRSMLRLCRGYEVKTEGTAAMAAFSSAWDAVQWALSLQVALVHADWDPALLKTPQACVVRETATHGVESLLYRGLRVRIGCHSGFPDVEMDPLTGRADFFGPMVNRAARVMGAAHGGQTIVSESTWELMGEHAVDTLAEADAAVAAAGSGPEDGDEGTLDADCVPIHTDLGPHRLKDLSSDEHLHQLEPRSIAGRLFPIPRSKRPPSWLIVDHVGVMDQVMGAYSSQIDSLNGELHELSSLVSSLSHQVSEVISKFTVARRFELLELDQQVSDLLGRQAKVGEHLPAMAVHEHEATVRIDAMAHVLDNVETQLGVIAELKARRSAVMRDGIVALEAVQADRREYTDDVAALQAEIAAFHAKRSEVEAVLANIRTWSNRDQLGLGAVFPAPGPPQ